MNDVLFATWLFLLVCGVAFQALTPRFYAHKRANQNGALMSAIFLGVSLLVLPQAVTNKYLLVLLPATAYLIANLTVLYAWKFHPLRTRRQVERSAYVISLITILLCVLLWLGAVTALSTMIVSLVLNAWVLIKIVYIIVAAKLPDTPDKRAKKLPSVSAAIPARNETHALTQNLKSLIGSDYPKLEILVLDDCSQDDTSQIIRSFAHDGVRFLEGNKPEGSWIGKNYAYHALAEEASGEFILFTGVDTRYNPGAITKLVNVMQSEKLDMLSVLPQHEMLRGKSALIQPMRYMTLLATTSSLQPPTISTSWLIRKSALAKLGGFSAVENSISPEVYFARRLSAKKRYSFFISGTDKEVTTLKKPASQVDTAIRTIYPRLKKSVGNHMLASLLYGLAFIVPLFGLLSSRFDSLSLAWLPALAAVCLALMSYGLVIAASYTPRQLLLAPFTYVLGVFGFYAVSLASVYAYERDSVLWKGRNICQPIMLNSVKKR